MGFMPISSVKLCGLTSGIPTFIQKKTGKQILDFWIENRPIFSAFSKPDEQWETIASDPYYDFDYQQIVPLTETFDMKPGDGIRVHCMYDNSNGSEDVYGGQGSNEEMCFVFFLYEPEEAAAKIGCLDFRE